MDDSGPNVEWKGEEYPCDEGNREYRYDEEDSGGKMSWIWNKGLGLGSKILFGGAVVSSAPLFLPPLVVISVLGVALSVPYGILLGSYACTEKLMSKLLPPPAPIWPGYGTIYYDDYDDDEDDGEEGVGYGGVVVMGKEENEVMEDVKARLVMEDVKARLEMSVESVDKEDEELGGDKCEVLEDCSYEPDEAVEENVYEKLVEGYFDEEGAFKGMKEEDEEEIITGRRDEERPMNQVEGISVVLEGDDLTGTIVEETGILIEEQSINEEEEVDLVGTIVEETSILIEEQLINEEEEVELVIEEHILEPSVIEEADSSCRVTCILVEERIDQERVSGDEEDELTRGTTGLLEKIRDEGRDDYKEEMHGWDGILDRDAEELELPIDAKCAYSNDARMSEDVFGENEEVRQTRYMETVETVLVEGSSVTEEEPKPMLEGGMTGNNDANSEADNSQPSRRSDIADESDGKISAGQQYNYSDYEAPEESEQSSQDTGFVTRYSSEQHVSVRVHEAEVKSPISYRKDMNVSPIESPISYRKDMNVSPIESPSTEEKIWEQIRAMRTIVGYKAVIHATCIEELKALYIFTGIEPPASFQDTPDLVEVNEKLQFLMAIVGVK